MQAPLHQEQRSEGNAAREASLPLLLQCTHGQPLQLATLAPASPSLCCCCCCCSCHAQRLKTKYGSGYRVSVLLQQQQHHTSGDPSLPAHTDTSTSGVPQIEGQPQPGGGDSTDTRLRLLPFGIPPDLAAVIERHLGQEVLSTGASMQRTANDKLAPTSAAGGQGGDGGAAAAVARYLNIVVPQNQDCQLLSFLNVLHVSGL